MLLVSGFATTLVVPNRGGIPPHAKAYTSFATTKGLFFQLRWR